MVRYGKQIYNISKHLQVVGCSDEAAYEQIVVTIHLTSASCLNRPWKMELTSCWRTQQISTRRSRWDDMNVPRRSLGRSAHHWCYVKELSSDPNDNRCLSYFITVCITHVHPCHRHDHDHHRHHHPRPHPHPHPASTQIGSSVFKNDFWLTQIKSLNFGNPAVLLQPFDISGNQETAWERYGGDESADGAVTMLLRSCWRSLVGSETAEMNFRTVLLPCYLELLGVAAGERDCGDESADGAATMLFGAVGVQLLGGETAETNLRTVLLPCYLELLGVAAGERDCGDESEDGAVTLLFGAVGVQLLGRETAEMNLRTGSETAETNLRTVDGAVISMLFGAVGGSCWGARLRRRICGRCCYHAI